MSRLDEALAAIDAANADDPHTIVVDGEVRPKELAHAALAMSWVQRLAPAADEAQLLAARAHHLRRWELPRSEYPEGRAGYLRWRRDQKARHAADLGAILRRVGYEEPMVERVQQLVRKEALGADPAAQVHEDALCLVFLDTQLDELVERLGDERVVEVLARTARKMSARALELAAGLSLSPTGRRALEAALS